MQAFSRLAGDQAGQVLGSQLPYVLQGLSVPVSVPVSGYHEPDRLSKYASLKQRLDIAVIATPDPLHTEPVLAAIRAGVPTVIEEKPMATRVAEAEKILEAAEEAGARSPTSRNPASARWRDGGPT